MPIHLLDERAYCGPLSDPVEDGCSAEMHIGLIKLNEETLRAYIKRYPEIVLGPGGTPVEHCGWLNELVGYVTAETLGLTVPANAGFILIAGEVHWWSQASDWPSVNVRFDLRNLQRGDPDKFAEALRKSIRALLRCRSLYAVIAFDDQIANQDRNLGNVLLGGLRELMLIDHGRILGGDGWLPGDLDASITVTNKLRDVLRPHSEGKAFRSKTCRAADDHRARVAEVEEALCLHLSGVLDAAVITAITAFVAARGTAAAVAARLGMML